MSIYYAVSIALLEVQQVCNEVRPINWTFTNTSLLPLKITSTSNRVSAFRKRRNIAN